MEKWIHWEMDLKWLINIDINNGGIETVFYVSLYF